MAVHPINDRLKVEIKKDEYGFGSDPVGFESGIVVEVPDIMIYLSFHSFAFEDSLSSEKLETVSNFYKQLIGKKIYWESLQDRGRRIKDGDKEYIMIQMTDVLAYDDDVDSEAHIVNQTGSAGSFNLQ